MSVTLTILLWPHNGKDDDLSAYEDDVLVLVTEHGGRVVQRVRRIGTDPVPPLETQIITFPDEDSLDGYLGDPSRTAMAARRDACIARTDMWRVEEAAGNVLGTA
ncbi:hypothetical protein [Gordonia soli]|uniref:DUF1330 domain-containing protein n=1 Tax=Gordonia soli NBRC 108243 TaxID=1223545 RepID=M0QJC3_9ACTN|nr:hypothetical protein [Gordonia soli]GAC67532.1 hypothetical protein GS4_08_01170 [Gordonia soli NBRC 108243]